MLLKHLSALRYLVRQGLAIRGHEENESNLIQLLHMWSAHDVDMKAWLKEGNYLSRDIINEQIKMMADQVLRNLLLEIRGARIFSILADEATDIACKEQMSVTICWLSDEYNIFEDPIGLVHLSKMDAATIFEALKDVLQRCILPVSQCRGQGYDGASCMSGRISEVASRFKVEEPVALYVHCLAHCLNLYRQDASRDCISIRDSLDLVIELVKLIKFYPKRTTLFEQIKANLSPETNSLKPLCPTRWTVRASAISAVLDNYDSLLSTLDEVYSTGRDEYVMKAGGFARQLQLFSTFFGLKLSVMIFAPTEQLSRTLQRKDTTVQEARNAALVTEAFLRRQRTEEAFDCFYKDVLSSSQNLTDGPVLPRQSKLPRRLDDGAPSAQPSTPAELHRRKYFEAIDVVCGEIKRRFDQKDLKLVAEVERLLLDSANGSATMQSSIIPEPILTTYCRRDLDKESLSLQLRMLPDIISQYNANSGSVIKKVTSVRTLCEILNFAREVSSFSHKYTFSCSFSSQSQSQQLLQRGPFQLFRD